MKNYYVVVFLISHIKGIVLGIQEEYNHYLPLIN